jgi:aspartate aminotransferase
MRISNRLKYVKPSATLSITAKAKAMKKEGIDVVSFGAGEPDLDTPDYIKDAAISAIKKGQTKYTPSIGTLELREAICKSLLKFNHLEYKPSDIIVSNGAKHSLYNIFQAICEDGDEVIIPSPYWLSYPEMVIMAGARPVFVGTEEKDGFKLKKSFLTSAITKKTKAVIINSPSNPTGCVYTKKELESVFEVLKDRQITIVSDEIYDRLIYDAVPRVSIASLSDAAKGMTVIVNGVSKTYSMTGWRIGYLASCDKDLTSAINNLQDHSTSNPSSISQAAALAALDNEDDSADKMRIEFERRRDYMVWRINKIKGLSCLKPEGAFYCFVNISKIDKDSNKFANRLLEEAKVAVIPGVGFGAADYIRLSFATNMETIEKGLDRIEKYLLSHSA